MNLTLASITTFNFYYDIRFWLFFALIIPVFRLLSFNSRARTFFLLLCNLLMLLALPTLTLRSLMFLVSLLSVVFLIGKFLNEEGFVNGRQKRILAAAIGILGVIGVLSFFKYSFIQDFFFNTAQKDEIGTSRYVFIIGISYSSFKMMHFLIECYKKKVVGLRYLNFLNYIFFFSAFISGPINRYNHFSEQLDSKNDSNAKIDMKTGGERVVHGLFKKFVLCTIIYPYALDTMQGNITELSAYGIMLGLYAYTLYFYFDFSGYSDIAIGSARIMGLKLPENFNYPFLKKNIQQLWASWHMSLTGWLTDYVYWPLSKKLRKIKYLKQRPLFLSNVSIIVTFIICGMWHGETFNFVIWGAYHGVGLAALNIYQKQKRKVRNGFVRSYFKSKYSEIAGVILTFHFFVFGLLFFSLKMDQIKALILKMF